MESGAQFRISRLRAQLDAVLNTGGWKPPEPAARMAALRSARFQRAGFGIFQMPGTGRPLAAGQNCGSVMGHDWQ
jgi:hypothetical protein